jgi:hypothetical protein
MGCRPCGCAESNAPVRSSVREDALNSPWIVANRAEQVRGLAEHLAINGVRILELRRNPASGEMLNKRIARLSGALLVLAVGSSIWFL